MSQQGPVSPRPRCCQPSPPRKGLQPCVSSGLLWQREVPVIVLWRPAKSAFSTKRLPLRCVCTPAPTATPRRPPVKAPASQKHRRFFPARVLGRAEGAPRPPAAAPPSWRRRSPTTREGLSSPWGSRVVGRGRKMSVASPASRDPAPHGAATSGRRETRGQSGHKGSRPGRRRAPGPPRRTRRPRSGTPAGGALPQAALPQASGAGTASRKSGGRPLPAAGPRAPRARPAAARRPRHYLQVTLRATRKAQPSTMAAPHSSSGRRAIWAARGRSRGAAAAPEPPHNDIAPGRGRGGVRAAGPLPLAHVSLPPACQPRRGGRAGPLRRRTRRRHVAPPRAGAQAARPGSAGARLPRRRRGRPPRAGEGAAGPRRGRARGAGPAALARPAALPPPPVRTLGNRFGRLLLSAQESAAVPVAGISKHVAQSLRPFCEDRAAAGSSSPTARSPTLPAAVMKDSTPSLQNKDFMFSLGLLPIIYRALTLNNDSIKLRKQFRKAHDTIRFCHRNNSVHSTLFQAPFITNNVKKSALQEVVVQAPS